MFSVSPGYFNGGTIPPMAVSAAAVSFEISCRSRFLIAARISAEKPSMRAMSPGARMSRL